MRTRRTSWLDSLAPSVESYVHELRFTEKDPLKGYLTNQLLIPKGICNKSSIRDALTFYIGEEDVFAEDGSLLKTRPKAEHLWDETEHHMVVPRAFFDEEMRKEFTDLHGVEWVEERLESNKLKLPDNIVPRDVTQEKALEAMAHHRGGTVNLACVAGDTKLGFNRGGKGFQMTIAQALERFSMVGRHQWDFSIPTMIRSKMEDRIGLHGIDDIVFRGLRLTKTLVLEDGKRLRLTSDHQVLTTRGWKSIDQGLQPGDLVYVDGVRQESIRKRKRSYKRISGFSHHPFARKQTRRWRTSGKVGRPKKGERKNKSITKERYSYVIEEHRAVVEAEMNGLSLEDFRERCRAGETDGLKFIDPSVYHVHHIDEDVANNHLYNLEVQERGAHIERHRLGYSAFGHGVPTPTKVKAITAGKYEGVYDVVCKDPHHNFVANGIVVHNCGMGKTAVALKYWVTLQRPALVVVNSAALADQWMRKIRHFLHADINIGHVQGQNRTWKDCPIVVATVQTLANRRWDWSMDFRRYFGVSFFDEGHHMAAPHFVKAADLFFGQRFSLTATAFRTDGLEAISMYHIGDIIYQDLKQELIPDTVFHQMEWESTELQYEGVIEWFIDKDGNEDFKRVGGMLDKANKVHHRKMCIELGAIDWRNNIIVKSVREDMKKDRQILILTHSVAHTRTLGGMIQKAYPDAGIVNGEDVAPFDRIPILEETNPVIATFDLAREALDKDVLDTLYICTPFGNANDLQQSWGRIQRRKPGKNETLVRVYEDLIHVPGLSKKGKPKRVDMSVKQCRALRTYLKALKYPFTDEEEETPWG